MNMRIESHCFLGNLGGIQLAQRFAVQISGSSSGDGGVRLQSGVLLWCRASLAGWCLLLHICK